MHLHACVLKVRPSVEAALERLLSGTDPISRELKEVPASSRPMNLPRA